MGFYIARNRVFSDKFYQYSKSQKSYRNLQFVILALFIVISGSALLHSVFYTYNNQNNGTQSIPDPYCDEALDMYSYIYHHTEENAVISFNKPRQLY